MSGLRPAHGLHRLSAAQYAAHEPIRRWLFRQSFFPAGAVYGRVRNPDADGVSGAGGPRQQEEKSGLVDKAQQDALRSERRRNALQEQLKSAVESENYEEAARLRDELRALPGQQ